MTNKAWVFIGSMILLISFSIGLILFDPPVVNLTSSQVKVSPPSSTPQPTVAGSATQSAQLYVVTRVIDGDTIKVDFNGAEETVRIVGINTPETVDPRRDVECLGKEASEFVQDLLMGKQVQLEPDATQSDRDRYGRLLRFVFLADGTDVGKLLIAEGFAQESLYSSKPHQYRAEYLVAQEQARSLQKGFWNSATCPDPATQ